MNRNLTTPTLGAFARKPTTLTFALKLSKADPRTFAASGDLNHLGLVSIAIVIDTVQVEVDEIPGIFRKLSDRVDKSRMENCQYDYNTALNILRDAYAAFSPGNYNKAKSLILDASKGLVACDQSYKDLPVHTSPIADALTKVLKKCNIAVVVFDTIIG